MKDFIIVTESVDFDMPYSDIEVMLKSLGVNGKCPGVIPIFKEVGTLITLEHLIGIYKPECILFWGQFSGLTPFLISEFSLAGQMILSTYIPRDHKLLSQTYEFDMNMELALDRFEELL